MQAIKPSTSCRFQAAANSSSILTTAASSAVPAYAVMADAITTPAPAAIRFRLCMRAWCHNQGPGAWGLGLGTWDLGLGTWDLGLGTTIALQTDPVTGTETVNF